MRREHIIREINRFSDQWCQTLAQEQSSVLSGVGVWVLLATLLDGADGQARAELETATGLPQHEAVEALNNLFELLEPFDGLKTAVAIWVDESISLLPKFVNRLVNVTVDVLPENQSVLDQWAAENTDRLIETFPITISEDTVVLLASALLARGKWEYPFDEYDGVLSANFSELDRAAVIDDGSTRISRVRIAATNGLDIHLVTGGETDAPSSVLSAGFAELQQSASVIPGSKLSVGEKIGCLEATVGKAVASSLSVRLKPFHIESNHDLTQHFELFGLQAASTIDAAHFPYMSNTPLTVSNGGQAAMIEFGPVGFEAAAITAFDLRACDPPEKEDQLLLISNFDRPFGFIVVHRETKLAIFSGWVDE